MQLRITKIAERAYSLIEPDLHNVRSLIDEQLASTSPATGEVLEYVRSYRGKMLRPALVLLGGKCCGKITDVHVQIAAIVELIHTAMLLHDDVVDESHPRRSGQTANSFYGNEAAIISGDFLFGRVFRMCAELPQQAIGKILADTCIRVCQGELEQNFHRGNRQLSEAEYLKIITEKSASFLSSCCYLGAFAADADTRQLSALADFGLNIGIAFQIAGDIRDIIGSENAMQKHADRDFAANTFTLPAIRLLTTVDADTREALLETLTHHDQTRQSRAALLKKYGCLDYAYARAAEFHKIAVEALVPLEESDAKTALIETADFCVTRSA